LTRIDSDEAVDMSLDDDDESEERDSDGEIREGNATVGEILDGDVGQVDLDQNQDLDHTADTLTDHVRNGSKRVLEDEDEGVEDDEEGDEDEDSDGDDQEVGMEWKMVREMYRKCLKTCQRSLVECIYFMRFSICCFLCVLWQVMCDEFSLLFCLFAHASHWSTTV